MTFLARRKKSPLAYIIAIVIIVAVSLLSKGLDKLGVWDSSIEKVAGSPVGQAKDIPTQNEDGLVATFINVGQGDSSLFVSNGVSMLIDSGEREYSATVIKTIKDYNIDTLDYLVITHAHSDHMGGMTDILSAVTVSNVIMSEPSDSSAETEQYAKLLESIDGSGANVIFSQPGYTFTLGSAECEIIAPYYVSQKEENDNSVVMRVDCFDSSFLLTGDSEETVEKQMLEKDYEKLDVDILKVGHHGSRTSSSPEFIKAVSPEVSIIQLAKDNRYNHPHGETIETLENAKSQILRTDEYGNITAVVNNDGYKLYY